jgi:hypothetical protein
VRLIGAEELTAASHAHMDRTAPIGPRPIHRIVASLGVDGEEFQAMLQTLRDQRKPSNEGEYAAGAVDGFVIGVRAARIAEGAEGV